MRISDWSSDVCSSDLVGFWVSGLALLLLTTALPWTDVWARGLQTVRFEMGWIQGPQQWKGGAEPLAVHHHDAMEEAASAQGDRPAERRPRPEIGSASRRERGGQVG